MFLKFAGFFIVSLLGLMALASMIDNIFVSSFVAALIIGVLGAKSE